MKEKIKKIVATLMTFVCVVTMSVVGTFADTDSSVSDMVSDFMAVSDPVGGYEVIADPWIMTKRNRTFRDNNDFMIILKKSGEVYTGGDIRVRITGEDSETVTVRIVRIKGVRDSRRLFRDNETVIDFYKNGSQIDEDKEDWEEDGEEEEDGELIGEPLKPIDFTRSWNRFY